MNTRYAAFASWGTWTVQKFVGDKGGVIVAAITGNGWEENERQARELVAELNACAARNNGNDCECVAYDDCYAASYCKRSIAKAA